MRKMTCAYMPILLAWAICTGCGIGYNRILFVTKTNASIELDTTPPTVAIGIGRLEGEFSPQFEDGEKIPTLASFKFEDDAVFASHLGSAFAVGDAAMAMSILYGDVTPGASYESRKNLLSDGAFDSSLELATKPEAKFLHKDLKFLEPGEVRPVFFGTDTSYGLKLAWSGLTAQYPDTARLGYARKEIALVPITYTRKNGKHHMSAASLLATIDSNVELKPVRSEESTEDSRGVDLDYLQYFATGKAATLMAMQQDVRKAMIVRLDPNREKFIVLGGTLPAEEKHVATRLLGIIDDTLQALTPSDPIAAEHHKRLNAVTKSFGIPKCYFTDKPSLKYIVYDDSASPKELKIWDDCDEGEPGPFDPDKFGSALRYWRVLGETVRHATAAIKQVKSDRSSVTLFKNGDKIEGPNWDDELTTLATQVERHRHRLRDLDTKIGGNRDVIAAYQYVVSML